MYKNLSKIKGRHEYDIKKVIYETLCFDVAQGRINGAPIETIKK